jgi:DNA-directed RNA polymerase specialized sigma24 family protein
LDDPGSVSVWLGQVKAGDRQAFQQLWERYFAQLVALVRKRMRSSPARIVDEEDVALSAFNSFYNGIAHGRFPRLQDRDDLWQVLLLLTRQKAVNMGRHESRQKRGGGKVQHLSALANPEASSSEFLAEIIGVAPAADFAAEMVEECRRLLDGLKDDRLRELAISKMEGYSNEELAVRAGCSVATV